MLGYCCWLVVYIFCVFKQKTAYEMRISDWSSDVCSSDLMDYNLRELGVGDLSVGKKVKQMAQGFYGRATAYESGLAAGEEAELGDALRRNLYGDIGRALCRERVCLYVLFHVVDDSLKKNNQEYNT